VTSVSIELSSDEAMVLHSWVARFNRSEDSQFEDQAEQRVLWDLEAVLEKSQIEPFAEEYDALLAGARERVRDPEH
jgi:hypothetical protein